MRHQSKQVIVNFQQCDVYFVVVYFNSHASHCIQMVQRRHLANVWHGVWCRPKFFRAERLVFSVATHLVSLLLLCCIRVWQITVAGKTGPKAEEFRLKVQQASTGYPWYTHAPPRVNTIKSLLHSNKKCQLFVIAISLSTIKPIFVITDRRTIQEFKFANSSCT